MVEKLIVQVATVLNETDHKLLARMLTTLGEQRFVAAVQQTLDTEQQGGMLTKNGKRRRTAGGVLCQWVKRSASTEEQRLIFARSARREDYLMVKTNLMVSKVSDAVSSEV